MQGVKIEENMNGTDFIPKVVNYCQLNDVKVFLLGGKPGIAETAAQNWASEFPGLRICGTCSGYFSDNDQVIQQISDSGAQVLIVGMGVPKQEVWLHENRMALSTVKVALAGGAILDFTANKFPRAPKFMQKTGLEWIYRLYREPRRLAKRYIVGNAVFLHHIFMKKIF
jgi:N-acetylglucosaminyldiphosphoundecaprenol N-acetyl-beta-D-mannosaminyltransferase